LVRPKGATECCLLLAKAVDYEQKSRIGNQTDGRVFLFLCTDDFWRDYHQMLEKGISFIREPKEKAYGTVAVFEDLYGNLWDLIGPHLNPLQKRGLENPADNVSFEILHPFITDHLLSATRQ
jgi:hypothetical protein